MSKKTLAVLQPGYLPWLGFFDQVMRSDVFVLYDDVQFDKNGWRNRNRVKSPSGPLWMTVPVKIKSLSQSICDVEIDNSKPWQRKHISTLSQYYRKAPFFEKYFPSISELLSAPWERISELDIALIHYFLDCLACKTEIVRSSKLKVTGDRCERLLNFCKHFSAEKYLSGNAAQSYLDLDMFGNHGIEVEWQNYNHPVYSQVGGDFIPYLSVLDLLLNCGPESAAIIGTQSSV